MNKKQLVAMWCGIAAIVFLMVPVIADPEVLKNGSWRAVQFIVVLVTGGLIVTFKDRKSERQLDVNRGFARVVLLLSLLAFVGFCTFGTVLFIDETQRDVDNDSWFAFVLGFVSVAVLWTIYLIVFSITAPLIRWIAKGFEYKSKEKRGN